MKWDNNTWAPIAEYRGVALLERPGGKRAVWEGEEYTTDGHIHLWHRKRPQAGMITVVALESERDAKAMLDAHPDPAGTYMSYQECCRLLGLDLPTPEFRWDDEQGVFV